MAHLCVTISLLAFVFLHKVVHSSKIVYRFEDPRESVELRHLVINAQNDHVYIGAVNKVYHLDEKLEEAHSPVQTGPKLDNLNCEPGFQIRFSVLT